MTTMMTIFAKTSLMCIVFLTITLPVFSDESSEIKLTFSHKGNHYEMLAVILCSAPSMDALKNMIYDYNHVKQVVKDAYSIEMLRNDANCHELLYRYKGMLWAVDVAFERHLESEKDIISFKMTKYTSSGTVPLPMIISSSGYYKLSYQKNAFYIEYYQTTNTSPVIAQEIYLSQVKANCLKYLKDLKKHIEDSNLSVPRS